MKCRDVRHKLKNLGFEKEPNKTGGSHEKWRATIGGFLGR